MVKESWENFNDFLFHLILKMNAEAFLLTDSSYHELIRQVSYLHYKVRLKKCKGQRFRALGSGYNTQLGYILETGKCLLASSEENF